MEIMGAVIAFLAALAVVLQKDSITPGAAGLSITYALQVTGLIIFLKK